jgi:hypothetical protein
MKGALILYILSGGWIFLTSSWPLAVGECVKIGRNLRFLAHGSSYSPVRDMGVSAWERGCQTTCCIRALEFLEVIWHSWCRGLLVSHSSGGICTWRDLHGKPNYWLVCREVSAWRFLVLFCVWKTGTVWPHSREGPPIAGRVKTNGSSLSRANGEVTKKFHV